MAAKVTSGDRCEEILLVSEVLVRSVVRHANAAPYLSQRHGGDTALLEEARSGVDQGLAR